MKSFRYDYSDGCMVEVEDGQYVPHELYERILRENRSLKEIMFEFEDWIKEHEEHITTQRKEFSIKIKDLVYRGI